MIKLPYKKKTVSKLIIQMLFQTTLSKDLFKPYIVKP